MLRGALFFIFSFSFLNVYAQQNPVAVPGELLVKFKKSQRSFTVLGKVISRAQVKYKRSWSHINLHHFEIKEGDTLDQAIERLESDPDVEFAEPNYYVKAANWTSFFPVLSLTSAPIQLEESWEYYSHRNSELPIVAVLDSGLDKNHSVFKNTGRLYINRAEANGISGFDDDRNGFEDDIHGWNFIDHNGDLTDPSGHGTDVCGIIVGVTENIFSFDVPDPQLQILPLKFLNSEGVGTTAHAVEAIYYAVDKGARILQNSWAGNFYSVSLHQALTYAYNRGLSIVSAAGNESINNDSFPSYPASLNIPSMIAVAATTSSDELADFSNYGPRSVHIAAPGANILSIALDGLYSYKHGTSIAAPFVSGLAAMIFREAPFLTGYQAKSIILESGDNLPKEIRGRVISGKRINALKTVKNAIEQQNNLMTFQPNYSPVYKQEARDLASTLDISGFGCGRVKDISSQGQNQNPSLVGNSFSQRPHPLTFLLMVLPFLLILGFKLTYNAVDEELK